MMRRLLPAPRPLYLILSGCSYIRVGTTRGNKKSSLRGYYKFSRVSIVEEKSTMHNYFLLFNANINAEEIRHITKAPVISELFFCEIPIRKSPTIITKKKIYAIVSIGIDFLNVAKPKIKARANWRAAHI